jgi:hypothetical protein
MAGAGHLRRLTPLLLALAGGCSYAGARMRDLGDILRLEGRIGYGLEAHANAGEFAHVGAGSAREWNAGWTYGRPKSYDTTEHHLPLTIVRSFLSPEAEHLHSTDFGDDGRHECFMLFPGGINAGGLEKVPSHFLDFEIGFMAGVVGAEAGLSLGETLDFVLGIFRFSDSWTFLDFGDDDDPDRRADKGSWRRVNRHEGPSNP